MVVFTGNTVEEAIQAGLSDLGITRTKASIRVLSRGKKGFFGFGKKPAKVDVEVISRTTVSQADQEIVRNLPKALSKREASEEALKQEAAESRKVTSIIKYLENRGQIVNDKAKSEMLDARRSITSVLSDLLPDEIVEEYRRKKEELDKEGLDWEDELEAEDSQAADSTELSPENSQKSVNQRAAGPVADDVVVQEDSAQSVAEDSEPEPRRFTNATSESNQTETKADKDIGEAAEAVTTYLENIIYEMDVEAGLTTNQSGRQITIQVEAPEAGRVIGYHGKVLKSLQILAQNFLHDHYSRSFSVTVNVHDYVERRMETLIDFAHKIAERVSDSGQAYHMDSMSNDERKIIHKTIAKIPDVDSYSEGHDPKRYVVVVPSRDD
ncbi:RNA-binding cell elongation regulator Jag/EloR [Streptococcus tangpeifui]|uniref:RNA-binding cell elongation regulator Jag/EloR n=1 Tax=Streptococcus tangpeifui TaxID=2709400 RepID=UPI0013EAD8AE|nr:MULTISPECIES: RNA-binding cell elongation regulator Jag/EloR [unclassified Streptococcus]